MYIIPLMQLKSCIADEKKVDYIRTRRACCACMLPMWFVYLPNKDWTCFGISNGLTGINQDLEFSPAKIMPNVFVFISSVNCMLPLIQFFFCLLCYLTWFVCCCFYFISFSPNCRLVMNLTTKTVHLFAYFCPLSFRLFHFVSRFCCSLARTYNRFRVAHRKKENMIRFAFFCVPIWKHSNELYWIARPLAKLEFDTDVRFICALKLKIVCSIMADC